MFDDVADYLIFQRIKNLLYSLPPDFDDSARDLVEKLVQLEVSRVTVSVKKQGQLKMKQIQPTKRLGACEEEVRAHAFFNGVPWDALTAVTPPTRKEGGVL